MQEPVPATDAALRALYVSGDELADLLLASHRLAQLPPALGLGGGVEGAVVAHKHWGTGPVRLRVVEGVEALALVPGGGGVFRSETRLRLRPGEPGPVLLFDLHNSRNLPSEQPVDWHAGRLGFHADAERDAAAAAAAGKECKGSNSGNAAACLGTRESCCLAALRLAKLTQLQQPLAELERLLKGAGAGGLGDAEALLGGGGGGGAVQLTPEDRAAALRLLHTIGAIRCQGLEKAALEGLMRLFGAAGPVEAATQGQGQRQLEQETGPAQDAFEPSPVRAAMEPPTARSAARDGSRSRLAERSPKRLRRASGYERRCEGDRGEQAHTRHSPGRRGRSRSRSRASSDRDGSGRRRQRSTSRDSGEGRAGGRRDSVRVDINPSAITHGISRAASSGRRTPAGDARLRGDFPPEAGSFSRRCELVELLLALGAVYAASADTSLNVPASGRLHPCHAGWDELGPEIAVPLEVLWQQLPASARRLLLDDAGERAAFPRAADCHTALARFVARRCSAMRLVRPAPERAPADAALVPGWRRELQRHGLLASCVGELEGALLAAGARHGALPIAEATRLAPPALRLYQMLFWTPALFCAAAFRDDRLVVAHGPGPHKEPVLLHPAELERRPELQRLRPAGAGHGAARAREEPARRRAPSDAQERGGGEGPGDADPVAEACMAVLRARMADLGVPRMQFGTACALLLARVPAIKTLRDANPRAKLAQLLPAAVLRQVLLHPVPQKTSVYLELAPLGRTPEYSPPVCEHGSARECPDGMQCTRIHTAP